MSLTKELSVVRVANETQRQQAIAVLRATYRQEKNWIRDETQFFPATDLVETDSVSWFVALVNGQPAGVLRVLYTPPLHLYHEYGFKSLVPGLDVDAFIRDHRIAEIGRFAVLPEYRRYIPVVAALINNAGRETIERGFSHYITDIFEGEQHNPYLFHTRVLGFIPMATHDVGELNCPNRRITLVVDIKATYRRLRGEGSWIYRAIFGTWPTKLHTEMSMAPVETFQPGSVLPAITNVGSPVLVSANS